MARKFLGIVTLLLFYLSHLSTAHAASPGVGEFLVEGGMTSDSIEMSKPVIDNFYKVENQNTYQVENPNRLASIKFTVKIPEGREASLSFKRFFQIYAATGQVRQGSETSIEFDVIADGKPVSHVFNSVRLQSRLVDLTMSGGQHEIEFRVNFLANGFNTIGSISDLSLHLHDYDERVLLREPICGKEGLSVVNCRVCGKQRSFKEKPQYTSHSLKVLPVKKFSCLSTPDTITVCEHCPYKEIRISRNSELTEHTFDGNGKCSVCHLQLPKSISGDTIYEVHSAAEMRVLSEMVSIGRISGNIGIDIKEDLVFRGDTLMMPLGTVDRPFQGVINGNGHRIRGITNCYQGVDGLGFVGVAKGTIKSHAVIANLVFDYSNTLAGMACVGGLVGYAENCDIVNCASFGALEGTDNVGGLIGYAGQFVSILNSAAHPTFKAKGSWNPMVCGMPHGHIQNSYGAGTNTDAGSLDELPTTTLRHCFSTLASADGLKKVSESTLTSYEMIELLNEQCEEATFTKGASDLYPIPVENTTITATSNKELPTKRAQLERRAPADDKALESSGKGSETVVLDGYDESNSDEKFGITIEEVMDKDSLEYYNFERLYATVRTIPKDAQMYDRMSGGDLIDFESVLISKELPFVINREYSVVAAERVRPLTETVDNASGPYEQIDEYSIVDGDYTLLSRITFENDYDIIYQENIDGLLQPIWSIGTEYNAESKNTVTNAYSYNYRTGEKRLEFTNESRNEENSYMDRKDYEEYTDRLTNTIHTIYSHRDPETGKVTSREHYILRGEDEYPLELIREEMEHGLPILKYGMYFVYENSTVLDQVVAYAPDEESGELMPYMYYEYLGGFQTQPYPTTGPTTAIQIPSVEQPSLLQRLDANVYDMQGQVVRRAIHGEDPFSGLQRGIYIYQGKKYIKRN